MSRSCASPTPVAQCRVLELFTWITYGGLMGTRKERTRLSPEANSAANGSPILAAFGLIGVLTSLGIAVESLFRTPEAGMSFWEALGAGALAFGLMLAGGIGTLMYEDKFPPGRMSTIFGTVLVLYGLAAMVSQIAGLIFAPEAGLFNAMPWGIPVALIAMLVGILALLFALLLRPSAKQ